MFLKVWLSKLEDRLYNYVVLLCLRCKYLIDLIFSSMLWRHYNDRKLFGLCVVIATNRNNSKQHHFSAFIWINCSDYAALSDHIVPTAIRLFWRPLGRTGGHQTTLAAIRPYWGLSGRNGGHQSVHGGDQAVLAAIRPYWRPSGRTVGDQAVLAILGSYWRTLSRNVWRPSGPNWPPVVILSCWDR